MVDVIPESDQQVVNGRTLYRVPILSGVPQLPESVPPPGIVYNPQTPNMQAGGVGPAPVRKMPRRYVDITIPFYGFHANVWVNWRIDQLQNALSQEHLANLENPEDAAIADDETLPDEERAQRAADRSVRTGAIEQAKRDYAARLAMFVRSTDFVDDEGNPFPATDDPRFWELLPPDLMGLLFDQIRAQIGTLSPLNKPR